MSDLVKLWINDLFSFTTRDTVKKKIPKVTTLYLRDQIKKR